MFVERNLYFSIIEILNFVRFRGINLRWCFLGKIYRNVDLVFFELFNWYFFVFCIYNFIYEY